MSDTGPAVTEEPLATPDEDFGRVPPHDIAAEQCAIGGMMLSKDAIADVMPVIGPQAHYRPAHQIIHEAILDLFSRGNPVDAVSVADQLGKTGQLVKVGGGPYLHTLIAAVPSAANAGYYAGIVADKASRRRLIETGTRTSQLGWDGEGEVADLINRAQADAFALTVQRGGDAHQVLSELMVPALDELEMIGTRGGTNGVPTGFADLDALTNGLHPGQLVIIGARPAVGKALALDTPLPTPTGWTTMGDVQVGDYLIGPDGKPTRVVAATEVMGGRPCYEVTFDDESRIVADADHQWITTTRAQRRQSGQHVTRYHWTAAQIAHVTSLARAAACGPDRAVTTTELLSEVGHGFGAVLRAKVIRGVESRLEDRTYRRRVNRRGDVKNYTHPVQTYSRRQLLCALADHVAAPKAAAQFHDHPRLVTTRQIAETVRCGPDHRLNHAVATCRPLDLPDADLPIPPYTLGAWLGDGDTASARFTTADRGIIAGIEADGLRATKISGPLKYSIQLPESSPTTERACAVCGKPVTSQASQVRTCGQVCGGRSNSDRWRASLGPAPKPTCPDCGGYASVGRQCRACRYHHGSVQAILRTIGVLGNKHIPPMYLRASEMQRRALLAGLLDTDGYAMPAGTVQLGLTSERLAAGAWELILSLGYRAVISTKQVKGHTAESSTCYTITFTPADEVFRLPRKLARQKSQTRPTTRCRFITNIQAIPSVPVRCVQVDSADQMYLAGRSMIPTHNSTLALDFARNAAIRHGMCSLIFSLEMGRMEVAMRVLSAEAKVALHAMRGGRLTDDDWARLARRMGEISDAPLWIDDSPMTTLMEIRAKCRLFKQAHNLRFVVVDYLQLMSSPKSRHENRQTEVSDMSRGLKLLAKELGVPILALSQLNRGPEQRQDKRPQLSDLRESGGLEQDADVVILLHREDAHEREHPRAGEADLIVAKHRNGPQATVTLAFQGHYSRFVDMAPA